MKIVPIQCLTYGSNDAFMIIYISKTIIIYMDITGKCRDGRYNQIQNFLCSSKTKMNQYVCMFFKPLMMRDTLHSFVSQVFDHFDLLYFWFSLFLGVRIFVASTNLINSFIHSSSYMSGFMYIFVLRWLCLLRSKRKCLDVSSAF